MAELFVCIYVSCIYHSISVYILNMMNDLLIQRKTFITLITLHIRNQIILVNKNTLINPP